MVKPCSPSLIRPNGFTLLEVLVAMVLLSLTMTLAFAALSQSARTWQAQIDNGDRVERRAAIDDLLRRQLLLALAEPGGARPIPADAPPVFSGDSRRAQWIAPLAAAGVGAGLYRVAVALEATQEGDRLVFEYALFDPSDDRARPSWQRRVLLSGLPPIEFDYWGRSGLADALEWHERWQPGTAAAPLLMRVRTFDPARADEWDEWVAPVAGGMRRP